MKDNPSNNFSVVLAEAMRAKGLNTSKLSRETGISERFIRFMLEDKTNQLPAAPYLHGYIMKIAEKLELNGEEVWNMYFKDDEGVKSSGISDHLPKNRFAVSKINKKIFIFALVIIAVVAYFIIQTVIGFDISRKLSLEGFNENIVVSQEKNYTIKGNIDPSFQLMINDILVEIEENGDFEKTIELKPDFNDIVFKVEGPFNKKEKLVKQIYYKEESSSEEETNSASSTSTIDYESEMEEMPFYQ
jgi:lambda repressor-like predicted transcriptional regulator